MKTSYAFTDTTHHIQESQFLFFILGLVYVNQGKLEQPLLMDQESLQKKRATNGHDKAHSEIAASLSNLALVCKGQGKLIERIQFYEESFADLSNAHQLLGSVQYKRQILSGKKY